VDSSSRDLLQEIERQAATLILTPFATASCARRRVDVVKCVGEDNVIDPLYRSLKQKRSQFHKHAILFRNHENEIELAMTLSKADFRCLRTLALGAVVKPNLFFTS
jgi:hypothetical protein